ncbi:DAK2 domain-containing protein [Streptomyces sp. NPDC102364]|uniref:DAK2 domain-containing protein n=1 Tax=Streptomyces sp. NPDC102364 TaxID=3366161 RepID=UPI003810BB9D
MTDTTTPSAALAADFGRLWVTGMFDAFLDRTEALGDLDRRAGDGDFGSNIASALGRARKNVDTTSPQTYGDWLTCVSRGFLGTGGTSGPLFGMFFRELARCTDADWPTLAEFTAGLAAGLATVQHYGKAEIGHKTMVDALAPAVRALREECVAEPGEALDGAAQAAIGGARSTASLIAKRGRASYVGEVARGVLDPGAAAAAMILQTAAAAQHANVASHDLTIDSGWLED